MGPMGSNQMGPMGSNQIGPSQMGPNQIGPDITSPYQMGPNETPQHFNTTCPIRTPYHPVNMTRPQPMNQNRVVTVTPESDSLLHPRFPNSPCVTGFSQFPCIFPANGFSHDQSHHYQQLTSHDARMQIGSRQPGAPGYPHGHPQHSQQLISNLQIPQPNPSIGGLNMNQRAPPNLAQRPVHQIPSTSRNRASSVSARRSAPTKLDMQVPSWMKKKQAGEEIEADAIGAGLEAQASNENRLQSEWEGSLVDRSQENLRDLPPIKGTGKGRGGRGMSRGPPSRGGFRRGML
eukprot:GHVN01050463.1.p1 GENE.GHVN01050463.1~~GHVN01050463.1.p1  ORF type:complete len:290 (-),score=16.36 GHVN01050463.1:1896-2765(-)